MSSTRERVQLDDLAIQYPEITFLSKAVQPSNNSAEDDNIAPYIQLEDLVDQSSRTTLLTETERPSSNSMSRGTEKTVTDKLGKWTLGRWAILVFEIIFSVIPILFIVIAIMATTLDQEKISPLGTSIQQAILLLPSIFPIIFAAIMGKFFKALALYRAERGVLLESLERLIGCQSLFGSIERQIALRRIDIFGFLIVLTWALSPVGGQSALRLITLIPHSIETNPTIRYLPKEASYASWLNSASGSALGWPSYAPLYIAALRTTRNQSSPTDPWGNIRIPDISSVSREDDWVQIDYSHSNFSYSSFVGIPTVGVPSTGNATFNMTSRYYTVTCDNSTYLDYYVAWNDTHYPSSFKMVGIPRPVDRTTVMLSFELNSITGSGPSRSQISQANFTVGVRDVDSSISCQDRNCQVTAMRLSNVSFEDQILALESMAQPNLWLQLPYATVGVQSHGATGSVMGSTPTELWLGDPSTDFFQTIGYVNISALDPQVLATRMQIVYNSFFQATYGAQYLVGNLTENLTYYDTAPLSGVTNISFNSTQAHVVQSDGHVYVCNWMFAVLFFTTSLILLLAGLATLLLKNMTLAPDILGYASTSIRDNSYAVLALDLDRGASHKDGLEQARALRRVRVMIGDVNGESEVGHIAFATMRAAPQRLRKDRQYD